ncbi:hypothetical protein BJP41_09185 [Candidatus Williamhamiltonella defendens]|uniref:Uncharacterized protein n=1 Tax=Candidatus Williamhamiltonella defendens TaxID=138072 RepID=A0A2D3T9L4_9ENTR|nr:hypothetical protein BJP41_09185 [Candidatus Hamiltonella defensa]ATW32478.1 hypothetical protein BJP42_09490 [Candidatus Hamiltonella defensa]
MMISNQILIGVSYYIDVVIISVWVIHFIPLSLQKQGFLLISFLITLMVFNVIPHTEKNFEV